MSNYGVFTKCVYVCVYDTVTSREFSNLRQRVITPQWQPYPYCSSFLADGTIRNKKTKQCPRQPLEVSYIAWGLCSGILFIRFTTQLLQFFFHSRYLRSLTHHHPPPTHTSTRTSQFPVLSQCVCVHPFNTFTMGQTIALYALISV